jgi:hypothetical protein
MFIMENFEILSLEENNVVQLCNAIEKNSIIITPINKLVNTFYWFLNDSKRDHQPQTTTTNQKEYFLKNCKKLLINIKVETWNFSLLILHIL